jgi:hypothetical protein
MSEKPFDFIYIDTNQLKENGWPFFCSRELGWLLTVSTDLGVRKCFPEPVLREIQKHRLEELCTTCRQTEATAKRVSDQLREMGFELPSLPDFPDNNSLRQAYEAYVDKMLSQYGIERVPFTSLDLKTMFDKAVVKELPFDRDNKNFKDAVIFWSIADHVAKEGGTGAFISKDGIFNKNRSEIMKIAQTAGANLMLCADPKEAFNILVEHVVDLKM